MISAYLEVTDGESEDVGFKEDVGRLDCEVSIGPKILDVSLMILVTGGGEPPPVVLVVVGMAGVLPGNPVCEVEVGNMGTVERSTKDF